MDVVDAVGGALDSFATLDTWLVCLLAAGFMVLETTALLGLLVPGDLAVLLAGSTVRGPAGFAAVVLAVTAGAMLGESGGYLLGRALGPRLRHTRLGRRLGEHRWARAEAYLSRYGAPALVPVRFVSVLHAIAPLAAGSAGMPVRRFLGWSTAGTLLWSAVYVGAGAAAGASVRAHQHLAMVAVGAVGALLGLPPLLRRAFSRRRSAAGVAIRPTGECREQPVASTDRPRVGPA